MSIYKLHLLSHDGWIWLSLSVIITIIKVILKLVVFFFFRVFVDFTFDSIHKIKKRKKKKIGQHEAIRASRMISNAYISYQ